MPLPCSQAFRERGPGRSVASGHGDAVETKSSPLLKTRDFNKTSDSPAVKGQIITFLVFIWQYSEAALQDLIPYPSIYRNQELALCLLPL